MVLTVRVVPRSSRVSVTPMPDHLKVRLTSPAHEGLANAQLREVLSDHFKIKKYRIRIVKGQTSKIKLVEISDG